LENRFMVTSEQIISRNDFNTERHAGDKSDLA
jgi:hypothetical protein